MVKNVLPWFLWTLGIAAMLDSCGLTIRQFRTELPESPTAKQSFAPELTNHSDSQPVYHLMEGWGVLARPEWDSSTESDNPMQYWMESSRIMREALASAGIKLGGCRWFGWEPILLSHPHMGKLAFEDRVGIYRQADKLRELILSLILTNSIYSIEIEWLAEAPGNKKGQGSNRLVVNFNISSWAQLWRQLVTHTVNYKLIEFKLTPFSIYRSGFEQYMTLDVRFSPQFKDAEITELHFPWSHYPKIPIWLFPDTFHNHQQAPAPGAQGNFSQPCWVVLHFNGKETLMQWQGAARFENVQTVVFSDPQSGASHYRNYGQSFAINGGDFNWSVIEIDDETLLNWSWGPCGMNGSIRHGEIILLPVYLCVSESAHSSRKNIWLLNVPEPWHEGTMEFTGWDSKKLLAEFNYTNALGESTIWQLELN